MVISIWGRDMVRGDLLGRGYIAAERRAGSAFGAAGCEGKWSFSLYGKVGYIKGIGCTVRDIWARACGKNLRTRRFPAEQ